MPSSVASQITMFLYLPLIALFSIRRDSICKTTSTSRETYVININQYGSSLEVLSNMRDLSTLVSFLFYRLSAIGEWKSSPIHG